jgi:anhydro-N-acetylmuramic acid kinase
LRLFCLDTQIDCLVKVSIYRVIGVMSGTSLDGLDFAYCEFELKDGKWHYTMGAAETIKYTETWVTRLRELHKQPMFVLAKTDAFYGKYIGQQLNVFIQKHQLSVDFIASHGHTIFHNPAEGYTTQIGNGSSIYAETGIPTIFDFRSLDVALSGQGAPLVPIGDELLFGEYDACLNLGGFANISFKKEGKRVAFDICPCNILLNQVAQQVDLAYDDEGKMAASGEVNQPLLETLDNLPFYQISGAKSLGREWVEQTIWPLLGGSEMSLEDLLATFTQHIANQVSNSLSQIGAQKVLITGGGVFNSYLLELINQQGHDGLFVPNHQLVNFKEALIFAFLGVLRKRNENNTLMEVTGAKRNSSGGVMVGF